jgi:TonB-dependent SusC/RagA subfamily outer membrane receptor
VTDYIMTALPKLLLLVTGLSSSSVYASSVANMSMSQLGTHCLVDSITRYQDSTAIFRTHCLPTKLPHYHTLILLDGKRANSRKVSRLSHIANVTVLKPAEAISQYGKRGKDGVILITSK